MRRIEFLIYSPYPSYSGGRENWLHNLAPALRRRGVGVTITSYASDRPRFHPDPDADLVRLPSLRGHDRRFLALNRLTLGLARLLDLLVAYPLLSRGHLRTSRSDVLVCMNSIPEGLAAALARVPFTVSVRGDSPAELAGRGGILGRPLRRLERWVLARAEQVLANGDDTRLRLERLGIASTVVPNGVDLERFSAAGPGDQVTAAIEKAAAGRPVLLAIGTLREIKGVTAALAVAARLKASGSRFLLALVGKGDRAGYQRRLESLGLADSVLLAGESDRIPAVLAEGRLFLALSGGGGMSMALLEAMAAGLPVVALDTPTYRQLVVDGRNGLLAADAESLAAACRRLLEDPRLAARLGAEAVETVRPYGWDEVAARLLAALDQHTVPGVRPPGRRSASPSAE